MTQLSPNFSLEELTRSQVASRNGFDNTPDPDVLANLTRLCETLLEPARIVLATHFGREVPLHVDSGYRSPVLNEIIGGAQNSAHCEGRAADVVPVGISLMDAFHTLMQSTLPLDQLIFECQSWIHMAIAAPGVTPRREFLLASGHPGAWTYTHA